MFNLFFKLDAIRGIINSLDFKFPFIGLFYGQCSEICGANHSFMPIVVESVPYNFFKY
jgi:cytochrome c oxidase subunit 2